YTYKPDSNLLLSVTDDTANPKGFNDGNTQNDDFEYDNNGNMTVDKNKNIKNITYNHLNLPTKILFGNSNYITYLYTSSGQKMEKIVYENNDRTTTDYINGFQYKTFPSGDGGLVFFPHAEGYVNVNESYKLTESSLYNYVFNYTDHLGNIRMSYTQTPTGALSILEVNHYYPFGLKHTNYNSDKRLYVRESVASKIKPVTPLFPLVYNYKYNGKEYQDELELNVYTMDARNYDPAIARWFVIDPITHFSATTYGAFNDNPIFWADPSGMAGEHYDWEKKSYVDSSGKTVSFEQAMAGNGLNSDGSEKKNANNETENTSDNTSNIHPKDAFGYEAKYPRTVQIMKQLHDFVKKNPSILKSLNKYSGYSTMQILDQLKYSEGRLVLTIEDLSWHKLQPDGVTMGNSTDSRIEIEIVKHLEILSNNEDIQSYSFYVATIILHEFVHAGRIANKLDKYNETEEMGTAWERKTFNGNTINHITSKDFYHKFNWNLNNYKSITLPINITPFLKN
ncbi:RHS repeat-associated core domain-containing protein, partial [Flavobacterium branchiophilum]